MARLFVGIGLDARWTERLAATAASLNGPLGRRVRWVRPELYHVTVVFLGDQAPDRLADIQDALAASAADVRPFPLRLRVLGRLGGHERGAIVCTVADPTGGLAAMRASLDAELQRLGVRFDAKPLSPHVTLGRPRTGAGRIEVPGVNLGAMPPLLVRTVHLVESTLSSAGPSYETVFSAALGR